MGAIPGSGRSAGEETGNPVQYFCLGNAMDRGAWGATVQGGHKESDMTEGLTYKKRWQEYSEKLYKKGLNDPDNQYGVVTHMELDIWTVRSSGL